MFTCMHAKKWYKCKGKFWHEYIHQRTLCKRWILSFTKYNLYEVEVKTPASRQEQNTRQKNCLIRSELYIVYWNEPSRGVAELPISRQRDTHAYLYRSLNQSRISRLPDHVIWSMLSVETQMRKRQRYKFNCTFLFLRRAAVFYSLVQGRLLTLQYTMESSPVQYIHKINLF